MSSNFTDNTATIANGGAIYFEQFGNLVIYFSHFSNNYGYSGGALYFSNSQSNSMIQIKSSDFTNTNSELCRGAIYFGEVENVSKYSSHFSNHYAYYYGGGALYIINSKSNSILTRILLITIPQIIMEEELFILSKMNWEICLYI